MPSTTTAFKFLKHPAFTGKYVLAILLHAICIARLSGRNLLHLAGEVPHTKYVSAVQLLQGLLEAVGVVIPLYVTVALTFTITPLRGAQMLNVVLECLRFAYTFLEVILNYLSKPSHFIDSLLYGRTTSCTIPGHLAISCTSRSAISIEALGKLIVYCARAGIRKVTLYDPWSYIISKREVLRHFTHYFALKTYSREISRIEFCDSDYSVCSNGSSMYTTVNLLGAKDGRQSLVRACRKLCSEFQPADITVERISDCLAQENIYEPDFLLQIGNLETMAGYPPWTLRATEILSLNGLSSDFSHQQFLSYMQNYSTRDRRFGR